VDLIKLHRIATRVARRRVSLETILDEVKKNCPTEIVQDIGKFLGKGGYGEAYEVDGGDKVLKIGVAETDAKAEELFQKQEKIKALDSDVFVTVYDFGILCEVDMPQSKYMIKSGTAY
jgi:hypothetical protein